MFAINLKSLCHGKEFKLCPCIFSSTLGTTLSRHQLVAAILEDNSRPYPILNDACVVLHSLFDMLFSDVYREAN